LIPDNSQVHLVHVIERPLLLDETIRYDPAWSVTLKQEMESAKPLLGEKLAAGARTTVMEANYVAEAICEQALNEGVDWVAIGERGRSQISRVFLGSNSRFVLRHAACSVLLVR
jgi:nucleotide-binding universal stress UspA family protein